MHSRREQGTMTEQSRRPKISMKNMLQLASSLLLPLMLGVFTVVITFHQQNVSKQQRIEDRQLAREQREQDLNLSSLLRAQDKEDARLQREQDLMLAGQQRAEDQQRRIQDLNISEIHREEQRAQRKQDLIIAQERLNQEKNLTQEQHRIGERQRAYELDLEQKRYWDRILTDYIKEVGQLIQEYNGSLTSNSIIALLVRVKTLTVVRQLSPVHNIQLLQFLYEAGQLTGKDSLDLSTAQLSNIDFSRLNTVSQLHNISLAGVHLINVSFDKTDLTGANFSGTYINNASFFRATLDFVQFSNSILDNIIIDHASGEKTNFIGATLSNVHIVNSRFVKSLFQEATLLVVTINNSEMYYANFVACSYKYIRAYDSKLRYVNFFKANIDDGIFFRCGLDESNFVNASAERANFTHVSMGSSNFSHCRMSGAKFFDIEANYADFSYADMISANFSSTTVNNARFFRAWLTSATLGFLVAHRADFSESRMIEADLRHAQLFSSSLVKTLLFKANLSGTHFHGANLSLADLRDTRINEIQLNTAVSIRGAQLSSGVYARNPNVIVNGDAHCHTSVNNSWKIENGSVFVRHISGNNSDCIFITNSTSGAYFVQKMDLSNSRFEDLLKSNRAVLILTARFGNTTSIGLDWIKKDKVQKRTLNSSVGLLRWRNNVGRAFSIGVWVNFASGATQETNWCDDIFLEIDEDDDVP